jgi:hypothetical protein
MSLCRKWWLKVRLNRMIRRFSLIFALFLAPLLAMGQTTRPSMPVLAWYQPAANVPTLVGMGVTTFVGEEVPNGRNLSPEALAAGKLAWRKAVADAGARCILKTPTGPLPVNCVGIILSVDEPNAKGIPPASLLGERDDLRSRYPGTPILLSLAGDKITSANFRAADQVQLYKDYAACADVLTVDWYSKNRNASRYPVTFTADAVKTLIAITGKPVIAWVDANDQQLPNPTSKTDGVHLDINRAPTPDEMKQTADAAIAAGASGVGWFLTCDSGKYGWPGSYLPLVDRNGVSMRPQYDAMRAISIDLAGPPVEPSPPVVTSPDVKALQQRVAQLEQNVDMTAKQIEAQGTVIRAINEATRQVPPATRPTN